jgi:hypothetical protein
MIDLAAAAAAPTNTTPTETETETERRKIISGEMNDLVNNYCTVCTH